MDVREKNAKSAQPCGCDPGIDWKCDRHDEEDAVTYRYKAVETKQGPSILDEKTRRKQHPLTTGVLDYFPDALMAVAHVSFVGNEQHNPGQPLHWDRAKSTDEADALMRHLKDRGKMDTDGTRHSAKVAWRALAILQKELEQEGK